MAANTG